MFPRPVSTVFRIYTILHDKAFSILRGVNNRHGKADVPSIPMKEQIEAPVFRSVMNLLHMGSVFPVTEKIFPVPVIWIGKNISFEIHVKLLPKSCSIVFRDCFTDGNRVFHFATSKKDSEG